MHTSCPSWRARWPAALPGLALCGVLAGASLLAAPWPGFVAWGLSPLTLAIVAGVLAGHLLPSRWLPTCDPGVQQAKQTLLRLGVVLYGLRLTLQDVAQVGGAGVLQDALTLGSTFALAWWFGTRVLGLDRQTALLVGAGSAVCGAAAVMATEPVVEGRDDQTSVAVATVVLFGTLATFAYPPLYQWNAVHGWIPGGATGFGIYTGATVHEVAQVVAAARSMGSEASHAAVIAKMVRVMMLAPLLLLLAWRLAPTQSGQTRTPRRLPVPGFAWGFTAVVLLHSLWPLPAGLGRLLTTVDNGLLAMAMAALGWSTRLAVIRQAGARPLLLAAVLWAWLVLGGGGIAWLVQRGSLL